MKVLKGFLMLSAGCLMLAVTWAIVIGGYLPVPSARAQTADEFVGIVQLSCNFPGGRQFVALSGNGDIWGFTASDGGCDYQAVSQQSYLGNVRGGAVPVGASGIGSLKGAYKPADQ